MFKFSNCWWFKSLFQALSFYVMYKSCAKALHIDQDMKLTFRLIVATLVLPSLFKRDLNAPY